MTEPQWQMLEQQLADKYVIWSFEHNAWWRDNSCGYSTNIFGAGLYCKAEADEIVKGANYGDERNEQARPAFEAIRGILDGFYTERRGATVWHAVTTACGMVQL